MTGIAAGARPVVGLICDTEVADGVSLSRIRARYCEAVRDGAGAAPLLIPVEVHAADLDALLPRLDGLVLTGAESNVQPELYGRHRETPDPLADPKRDAVAMAALLRMRDLGMPFLGICRGLQELNVAFGGTLHQDLGGRDGLVHWEDTRLPRDEQYLEAHPVETAAGGLLHALTGRRELRVNSLHRQGIDGLAAGLRVEARAPDGLVEAVGLEGHPGFCLAVQWHVEWHYVTDELSQTILAAFGRACAEYRSRRQGS